MVVEEKEEKKVDEEEAEEGEGKRMSRRRRRKEGEEKKADRAKCGFGGGHGDRATGARPAVRARNPRPLGGGAV